MRSMFSSWLASKCLHFPGEEDGIVIKRENIVKLRKMLKEAQASVPVDSPDFNQEVSEYSGPS